MHEYTKDVPKSHFIVGIQKKRIRNKESSSEKLLKETRRIYKEDQNAYFLEIPDKKNPLGEYHYFLMPAHHGQIDLNKIL